MDKQFVSRGGIKLQAALDKFKGDVKDKVVLDVGSSTGGFVDCLLQNGASKVYAVDTAYGELAWKLRNNPRVIVMERTNILYMQHLRGETKESPGSHLGGEEKVDLITVDCGWTKLELVLPAVKKFLKKNGLIVALLKPHYETDKRNLVKGVVRPNLVKSVKEEVVKKIESLGLIHPMLTHCKVLDEMESPILGGGGNTEYLLLIKPHL